MKPRIIMALYFLVAAGLPGKQLHADASVDPVSQPVWSIGAYTLKQTNLSPGATKAYRTWFENGTWQGDIIEYDIDTNGKHSTDVAVGTHPAVDGSNNWSARFEFLNQEATVTDYWKSASGRKIITRDSNSQVAFRWDSLSDSQRNLLDPATKTTGTWDSPVLNFVRGDRSQERPAGIFRKRHGLLGDTGKTQPLYIGTPSQTLPASGHAQYRIASAHRAGQIIIGANDGMIHVFNADTGIEVYAYVPSMLFPALHRFATPAWQHAWFADGQLASGDAKIGASWKTLVAGGLGAGARGLFALDVTVPTLSNEAPITADDTKILWEHTGDGLGYIHGKPAIAPLSDDDWYVISGNGYGSVTGTATLYLAPVDGSTPINIATDNVTGNGLSAPALVDTDGDEYIDTAYAGDLLGNLWKFDLNNTGTAGQLLFAAGTSKSVTTTPDIAVHPGGGYLIYFGTGSLLSAADATDTSQQTIYAIWDHPHHSSAVADGVDDNGNRILLSQTLSVTEYTDPADSTKTVPVRLVTDKKPDWSYHRGWKTDLSGNTGERVLGDLQLRGNRLQFVTDLPASHNSNQAGDSWLLELDWLSGGTTGEVIFDLNHDGIQNNNDKTTSGRSELQPPVGINLGPGNRSQPAFARIANGRDALFINGVNLAALECGFFCAGGLLDQLVSYSCSAGSGIDCKKEHGYMELEKLLEERVDDAAEFLELKKYLEGEPASSGTDIDSTGEIAIDVDGSGDLVLDVEYPATPTGRLSWIDLDS